MTIVSLSDWDLYYALHLLQDVAELEEGGLVEVAFKELARLKGKHLRAVAADVGDHADFGEVNVADRVGVRAMVAVIAAARVDRPDELGESVPLILEGDRCRPLYPHA